MTTSHLPEPGVFRENGPWRIDPARLAWATELTALRAASRAEVGPLTKPRKLPPLRRFVEAGNQVVYSTHSPAFLNAARLDEVVFVERLPAEGTQTARAAPVTADQDFRVFSEFDAERSELLLARAALLVEGLTEKLAFPFVFAALGPTLYDRVLWGALALTYALRYDPDEKLEEGEARAPRATAEKPPSHALTPRRTR